MPDSRIRYVLMMPFGVMVTLLLVVPLALFVVYSFLTGAAFSVEWQPTLTNYAETLEDVAFWRLLHNSMVIAAATTGIALPLGYVLAYHLRFKASIGRSALLGLIVIAIIGGYLVRVYAWRVLLGTEGVLNSTLLSIGILDQPIKGLLFSRTAVITALANFYIPFVTVLIYGALQSVDVKVVHAARDLGASGIVMFRRIILPLTGRAVFGSFAFVFLLTVADYITPQILGGTGGAMVGVAIFDQFVRLGNWPLGAAMSLVLVALSSVILGAVALLMRALKFMGSPT